MTTSSQSVHFTASPPSLCGPLSGACRSADLPIHLSPFIGRAAELRDLSLQLGGSRVLTLTGAGGCGKSRLACELAASAVPQFERVVWVNLASLADGALVAREAAAAFGGLPRDDSPAASLAAAIGETRVLLVLDGCEHVVDACAELAERLLRACPALRLLVTSREALGIPSERAWLVPPLVRVEAVELFLERARASLPSFAPSEAGMAAIREICRRLDGIPLAIELAAARVRVLSPEQIADRLGDALRLLTGGTRTALPRQRTLRGTLDWSYHLLCTREQQLLARLSVFAGSFSLEAAEEVCAGAPLEPEDILDGVAALVDRSLVEMEPGEDHARYRLLEIVRQYAAERLSVAGEAEQLRERHGAFFVALAAELAPRLLVGETDPRVLARIEAEHENLRAAGEWAAESPAQRTATLHLTDVLFWYAYARGSWFETGQFRDARRSIAVAVAASGDAAPLLRGRLLAADGLSAFAQGDYDHARAALEASVALMRAHGDAHAVAFVLSKLGAAHLMRGDTELARRLLDESLEMVRGTPAAALRAYVCLWRGWAAHLGGEDPVARAMLDEAIQLGHRSGHHATFAHASALLGRLEYAQGNFGRAFARLHEALRADLDAGDGWGVSVDLEGMIGLTVARGAYVNACRLMGGVDALRERITVAPLASDRAERARLTGILRERLGPDAGRHHDEGRALPIDELVRIATDGAGEHTEEYRVPILAEPAFVQGGGAVSAAAAPRPSLRVLALGPLQVFVGDQPIDATAWGSARTRELLVFLLMHPDGCTKEQVGLAFWPEASSAQLRNSFHVTLHRLRRALRNPEWITLAGDRYRVDPAVVAEFDVVELEREVPAARRALRRREEGATAMLERALARFHGDFLDGEAVGDWHLEHRDRLQRLYVDALMELAGRLADEERWEKAADAYRRVLARDDLHEEAARALMRCHARLGERAQALRLYQRFADRLRDELDAEPDEETRQVYARVQQGRG